MALLENLKSGQVYLVKVSSSNDMGDGPFSHTIELTIRTDLSSGHDSRLSRDFTHTTGWWHQMIQYVIKKLRHCLKKEDIQ